MGGVVRVSAAFVTGVKTAGSDDIDGVDGEAKSPVNDAGSDGIDDFVGEVRPECISDNNFVTFCGRLRSRFCSRTRDSCSSNLAT